jgi:hypothetical protein
MLSRGTISVACSQNWMKKSLPAALRILSRGTISVACFSRLDEKKILANLGALTSTNFEFSISIHLMLLQNILKKTRLQNSSNFALLSLAEFCTLRFSDSQNLAILAHIISSRLIKSIAFNCCSAQTRTGMGHLRKPPGVELIPAVD